MVTDYYALLGVEPKADRASIEAALGKCQPRWSAGTRNPKTKHTYQSYLDQIPSIRLSLLGDPTSRAAYDAELATEHRAERDRLFQEIQRLIRLRAAKGGLTVSDRDRLRREAINRGLSTEELDRLLEPIPPRVEAPRADDDPPDPPVDVVDPATRRQIKLALEHLRKRDLYDVLGLSRDAPAREILARADKERRKWMRKSQVTAEKTAWLEAVSYAQSHLGTAQARGRYDRTLAFEAEALFLDSVKFAVEGEPRLEPGTRTALLDEASSLGLVPDRAERLIRRTCRGMGVSLDAPPTAAGGLVKARWLRCRACGGVTDFHKASRSDQPECKHCRASLRWQCPACRRDHWVDEPRCSCGFPLELHEPMVRHFEAAQQAHRARNYAAALAHLHRVQEFAPHHVGTRKAVERVKLRLAEIDGVRAAFDLEFARNHMLAALEALRQWSQLVDPTSTELRKAHQEVTRRLKEARNRTSHAVELLDQRPDEARRLFREALALAADLPEARDGLLRCPPDPPTDLRVEVEGRKVRLRWSPPAPDGLGDIHFLVVRKLKGIPASPSDGTLVADTTATECEDPGTGGGSVVGYAVYSRRGPLDCPRPATIGPLLVLADVTDLRVEMRSSEVELNWVLPDGATGVRVVRKAGSPPSGPDDGLTVESLPEQALDRGLQDDKIYHYGVFALYRGPDGKPRTSRGVFVAAMPHRPIEPLADLEMTPSPDGRLRLSWPATARGQVKILRSPAHPGWQPGDQVTSQQVDAAAGTWLPVSAPDYAYDPHPITSGVCHYTALTSWSGQLTVGPTRTYSLVPDPSDLRVVRSGSNGKIQLRWRWNPACPQALVLCKPGSAATGPGDPDAIKQVISEADYNRYGYLSLQLPAGQTGPWHIRIYGLTVIDGGLATSPGLDPTSHTQIIGPSTEVTLSYSIHRSRFPGRSWSIEFHTDPPNSPIPPTILIANPRAVPVGPDDGKVVERFPECTDGTTFPLHNIKGFQRMHLRIFADPAIAPERRTPVRWRHPEAECTRV